MLVKKNFGQKFLSKIMIYFFIFGSKKNLGQKIFGSKKFLWVKKFLGHKNYGSKIFWVKNFCAKKILVKKDLDPNFFLSKNNQVGLTQGGGYMTPPPQKVVGLKLCWIVVSFAW